jgi:hypothetical protein
MNNEGGGRKKYGCGSTGLKGKRSLFDSYAGLIYY